MHDDQYADLGGGGGSSGFRVDTQAYDGPAGIAAGGPGGTPLVIPRTYQHQWSHELQFSGKLLSNVDFIAGAYYRSEEHTSELQSLMRISYAVFCLKKKKKT